MNKYSDYKRNHIILPGREKALEDFLNSSFNGAKHKIKHSYSSHSEDALTWSCFDIISQLPESKKINTLDEILEHSFCGNDMNQKMPFSFMNEKDIEIQVGKKYKGPHTKEETELDASISTSKKLIFFEAKLYSSISLMDKKNNKPFDQIAKKIRVGLDYASKERLEFFFIFLDIAPRKELYKFTNEKKSKSNAMKSPPKKWKSVWWFNRYKNGWRNNLSPLEKIIDDIPTSQSVRSVSENMGWLTWFDLFKITMKGMI